MRVQWFIVSFIVSFICSFMTVGIPAICLANSQDQAEFKTLLESFASDHKLYKIPDFDYSYINNLNSVPDLDVLADHTQLFKDYQIKLNQVDRFQLVKDTRYLYDLFKYEINFNLERLRLEKDFKSTRPRSKYPSDGLFKLKNHKDWYKLYAQRWASKKITPTQLLELGNLEIRKVKSKIKIIQDRLGYSGDDVSFYRYLNSKYFLIRDLQKVIQQYQEKLGVISKHLPILFLNNKIPPVKIMPLPNADALSPPGLYSSADKTFYLNFYGQKHNTRSMAWLLIHEAVPGHHYHSSVSALNQPFAPDFRKLFWYPGHSEGWAAYTEHLGETLGVYRDDTDWLGKWEWDLVRSVRIVLDVGIHFKGWTDLKATAFWKKHIKNQDGIIKRELNRIRKWPGQVLSYKVGENFVFKLKKSSIAKMGKKFDIRHFHQKIIEKGSMPLEVLGKYVTEGLTP